MDKESFNSMVEKYKNELMKYLKKNKIFSENSVTNEEINSLSDTKKNAEKINTENVAVENITYEEFMTDNPKKGYLTVKTFCDNDIPLDGIRVRIKKDFSNGERIFFDGYTDEKGNIYDILLPAPDHTDIEKSDQNGCPYTVYEVETSHENYFTSSADSVKSFDHIESIYPIKIILPNKEQNS